MRARLRLLLRLPLGPGRHAFPPSALDGFPRLLHLCNASRGRLSSPRHPTMSGMARGVQRALTARPARLAGRTIIMRADILAGPVSLQLSPGWQKPATHGTLAEPVDTLAKRLRRRAAPHITPLHLRRDSFEMQSTNPSASPQDMRMKKGGMPPACRPSRLLAFAGSLADRATLISAAAHTNQNVAVGRGPFENALNRYVLSDRDGANHVNPPLRPQDQVVTNWLKFH